MPKGRADCSASADGRRSADLILKHIHRFQLGVPPKGNGDHLPLPFDPSIRGSNVWILASLRGPLLYVLSCLRGNDSRLKLARGAAEGKDGIENEWVAWIERDRVAHARSQAKNTSARELKFAVFLGLRLRDMRIH